jgi:hypothetical protein
VGEHIQPLQEDSPAHRQALNRAGTGQAGAFAGMTLFAVINVAMYKHWTVGISGYATRLTESLLPVRCTQTGPKKLKGLLPRSEEIEAELSRTACENSGG